MKNIIWSADTQNMYVTIQLYMWQWSHKAQMDTVANVARACLEEVAHNLQHA